MDEDEDDDQELASHVLVRPYSATPGSADAQRPRERRIFRPKPPSEQRKIQKSYLSSVTEETSYSVLQNALRRQDAAFGGGAGVPFVPQQFQGMSLSKFGVSDFTGLSSNAQLSGGRRGSAMPTRERKKEWKEGKSMDLADLAFTPLRRTADGQIRKNYTPISLPYYNVTEDDDVPAVEVGGASASSSAKKGRPTLHHVDEANSNAAKELFLNSDNDLQEDSVFLIQLPCVLPELLDQSEEVQREEEDAATAGAGASITRIPDGLFGKLKIHKSGKVRMEIAGLPFCVDQGCTTFFQQDLACVCPEAREIVNLGAIQNRVVLTPDVGALLADDTGEAPPPSAPMPPPSGHPAAAATATLAGAPASAAAAAAAPTASAGSSK